MKKHTHCAAALIVMVPMIMAFCMMIPGTALSGTGPVEFSGYIEQGANFGIAGDKQDNKEGFQQAVTKVLLEARHDFSDTLFFYGSGRLDVDLAYDLLHDNHEWESKGFNKSRDERQMLDEWNDLLFEAHLTWTPGDFRIRVGKQIIQWGEMDIVPVTSQVSPQDYRRGYTENDFELLFLPVTMAKIEYYPPIFTESVSHVAIELVINPGIEFRGTEGWVEASSQDAGIWTPDMMDLWIPANYAEDIDFKEPDHYEEFGLRVSADIFETYIQVMYFNGIQNNPVVTEVDAWFTSTKAGYRDEEFIGMSLSRELPFSLSALGGVKPVLRLETAYFFDSTIGFYYIPDYFMSLIKDKWLWGVGLDWKIDIPLLNPRADITVYPEVVQELVLDTNTAEVDAVSGAQKTTSWNLTLETLYLHDKLKASLFIQYESEYNTRQINPAIEYSPDENWTYRLGVRWFDGTKDITWNHKDHIYASVSYQF